MHNVFHRQKVCTVSLLRCGSTRPHPSRGEAKAVVVMGAKLLPHACCSICSRAFKTPSAKLETTQFLQDPKAPTHTQGELKSACLFSREPFHDVSGSPRVTTHFGDSTENESMSTPEMNSWTPLPGVGGRASRSSLRIRTWEVAACGPLQHPKRNSNLYP